MSSWLTWKISLVSLSLRNIFLQQNNTYYFSCVCTLILDSCESNFEFPLIWIVLKHFTINKIESHLGIQKSMCNIYINTLFHILLSHHKINWTVNQISFKVHLGGIKMRPKMNLATTLTLSMGIALCSGMGPTYLWRGCEKSNSSNLYNSGLEVKNIFNNQTIKMADYKGQV